MSRRELREHIFKFLFRIEFNDREEMPEQEQFFFEMLKRTSRPRAIRLSRSLTSLTR